jgi:hypothetical protein
VARPCGCTVVRLAFPQEPEVRGQQVGITAYRRWDGSTAMVARLPWAERARRQDEWPRVLTPGVTPLPRGQALGSVGCGALAALSQSGPA